MRLVKDIPHEKYKIQLFQYNGKYILKIELGQYEQSFKIDELDIQNTDDIDKMITEEFLQNCLKRFLTMRRDWEKAFDKVDQEKMVEAMERLNIPAKIVNILKSIGLKKGLERKLKLK